MSSEKPAQEKDLGGAAMVWTVGGRTLQVGRVRLRDLMALAQRIQDRRAEFFFRAVKNKLAPDQAVKVLAAICIADVSERDRTEAMLSPDGGAFLLWRAIQRYQPDVTEEQVLEWADSDPALVDRLLFGSKVAQPGNAENPAADPTKGGSLPTGSPNSSASAPPASSVPGRNSSTSNGPSSVR